MNAVLDVLLENENINYIKVEKAIIKIQRYFKTKIPKTIFRD